MPVLARRPLRRMRGGAQAFLMEAADGHHYVVKFTDNPQHRRVLVNEFAASILLTHLDIAQPETRVIEITPDFLRDHPEVFIQLGTSRREVTPGWHFGSRFPGNPMTQAVYDILPDALMAKVANPEDFLGVLAFDKWAGNSDSRQAIFFRARLADWKADAVGNPLQVGFVAQMMDHGYLFDGPNWEFRDAPMFGLYFRSIVYRRVRGVADFAPWLERIRNFPEELMDRVLREVPELWLPGAERDELQRLLESLLRRRKRVESLLEDCTRARTNPFPEWQGLR
ncbi:MAG TPA: HipA family kinase [Bryobacteraceae bacterium]|nr:HipA family kinase [Bryobacteraceae bacterium]